MTRIQPEDTPVIIPGDMKLCATHVDDAEIIQGRRNFFVYRDFGVEEATNGFMRVHSITAKEAMSKETGWHYHECGAQLVYVINGWVELEFEDGSRKRMHKGDVIFIPGYYPHNETVTSDDYEALEVVVPAKMGTQLTDVPAAFLASSPA